MFVHACGYFYGIIEAVHASKSQEEASIEAGKR
jgi:hypothetical protein